MADLSGPVGDTQPGVGDLVRQFHQVFDLPVRSTPSTDIPVAEAALRLDLLSEEFEEYHDAHYAEDITEMADALADIVYVAYGTALAYGIDLDAVIAEVHRSNMSKLGADGRPILRADGKVIKGPGYFRPDIAAVLGADHG